jgi:hypothetical protein
MKIRYKFLIDNDVKLKYRTKNSIKNQIAIYLNDPDGWSKYSFEDVEKNEDVLIRLSSSKTIGSICSDEKLSCAELGGRVIYLNAERWFHGSKLSKLSLHDYRQYMVSHEMGHILGHDHEVCPCVGCSAPIMMQQTLGIGSCKPNTKV